MTPGGKTALQILNLAGLAGTVVVNALANALPIGGRTTGELADLYPNLFVPAGLTFSIWALIYLLLAVFCVYQARDLFARDRAAAPYLQRIGGWFLVSSAANSGWIFAWHFRRPTVSLAVMLVLLLSLIAIYTRLGIGSGSHPRAERLCVHLPFSVYLGWITIATVANTTALLVHLRWNRFGLSEEPWALIMLAAAAALAALMLLRFADVPYALVVLWAFAGVALKRLSVGERPRIPLLVGLACLAGFVIVLLCLRCRRWLALLRQAGP